MIKNVGRKRYLVRVYHGRNAYGKRRSVSKIIYGTRSVAEEYELGLLQRKSQGHPLKESKLTLSAYFKEWHKAVSERMKERTHIGYQSLFIRHIEPLLGHARFVLLTPLEIEQLYSEKRKEGYSGRTVEAIHSLLSIMYADAVRWQQIKQSPVPYVKTPKRKKSEMKCLTPQTAPRFLTATYQVTHGLVLRFALQTGLRPEEYLGLKWPYLDFDYTTRRGQRLGRATVRETVIPGKPGGGWWWSTPKSDSGYRDVLFPLPLLQELAQHRTQQLEHKMKLGRHYQDYDLVFASPTGTPVDARMLSFKMFKQALKVAGLPDCRLYDLRHSWVTLSIMAGADIKTVSEQAGHATVAFTLQVYGHVLPEMRESAVDKFEALLASRHHHGTK